MFRIYTVLGRHRGCMNWEKAALWASHTCKQSLRYFQERLGYFRDIRYVPLWGTPGRIQKVDLPPQFWSNIPMVWITVRFGCSTFASALNSGQVYVLGRSMSCELTGNTESGAFERRSRPYLQASCSFMVKTPCKGMI